MSIKYNVTGNRRKTLAKAIGEILEVDVVYNYAPTFSYTAGNVTVDRNGTVTYSSDVLPEIIIVLVSALKERGFEPEDYDYKRVYEVSEPENNRLVIEMPRSHLSDTTLDNIKKIVASKESLIKKALNADRLPIFSDNNSVRFPWFTLTDTDGEFDAYAQFVSLLCEMAKRQKRVTATEKESVNDKFDFRVFLIRLGFVGVEYKRSRKILLRNLTGNSAHKNVP